MPLFGDREFGERLRIGQAVALRGCNRAVEHAARYLGRAAEGCRGREIDVQLLHGGAWSRYVVAPVGRHQLGAVHHGPEATQPRGIGDFEFQVLSARRIDLRVHQRKDHLADRLVLLAVRRFTAARAAFRLRIAGVARPVATVTQATVIADFSVTVGVLIYHPVVATPVKAVSATAVPEKITVARATAHKPAEGHATGLVVHFSQQHTRRTVRIDLEQAVMHHHLPT